MSILRELKRRNVIKVAIAYAVVAWLLIEVSATTFPMLRLPEWTATFVTVLMMIGFPVALIFAWAFEITPEGIKLEKDVDRSQSITHITGRNIDYIIIAALILALGFFAFDRFVLGPSRDADLVQATTKAVTEQMTDSGSTETVDRSIAVLPFVNLSSDEEQEWFANGLTGEILNSLARTPDLLVAARTSSFVFKESSEDIPTIAKMLGVKHILEGTVRRSGERLRVTAQLVRAIDGFQLWSANFDRQPNDVIEIQEEIATEIAKALETAMDPTALALMVSSGTTSVPAFEAYLEGLAYDVLESSSGDRYEALRMRAAYERAVQLDPEFALAHYRMATFWRQQLSVTNIYSGLTGLTPEEIRSRLENAINRAIDNEQDSVNKISYEAYKAYAGLKYLRALRLYTQFLEQRPNAHSAQIWQLSLLSEIGMYDEAAVAVALFHERDKYHAGVATRSILVLLFGGDDESLRTFANDAVERFSDNNAGVLYQAHRALLWAGETYRASKILPIIQSSQLPEVNRILASLRQACAEDRLAEATRIYSRIIEHSSSTIGATWLSHRIMGKEEEAIAVLMNLDNRQDLTAIAVFQRYGFFDPRSFPNLSAMLERQGIPPREVVNIPYQCRP